MTTKPRLNGHEAMKRYSNMWRHQHMPRWLYRLVASKAAAEERRLLGHDAVYSDFRSHFGSALDHEGTILIGLGGFEPIPAFIVQPYGEHDEKMKEIAVKFNCDVYIQENASIWNEGTWLYTFTPKDSRISAHDLIATEDHYPGAIRLHNTKLFIIEQLDGGDMHATIPLGLFMRLVHQWEKEKTPEEQLVQERMLDLCYEDQDNEELKTFISKNI